MAVVKELAALYELATKAGWIDRLKANLGLSHRIIILGSTGVGKTNLRASLRDFNAEAIDARARTEFRIDNVVRVNRELISIVDVPGSKEQSSRRLDTIKEASRRGVAGVINVVCYGYHEYEAGRSRALVREGVVDQDYLAQHRELELAALTEWAPFLGSRDVAGWLLTVVSKADLWWNERDEVLHYYQSGPYARTLGEVQDLQQTVVPFCAVFHKFYGSVALAGSFDDEDRRHARQNFARILIEAIGKGHQRA